jgi:hypothetical protein
MSENITKDTNVEEQVIDEPVVDEGKTQIDNSPDVAKRMEEFELTLADYKKQLGTRDRKVNELLTTIEDLKREKMTDEERFSLDKQRFEEQQALFEQQKVEFNREKMRNYVSDKLNSLGYFSGLDVSEISNLKEMVLADTIEEADKKIGSLANTLGKITQSKFEGAGKPAVSKQGTGIVWNPWAPDQYNVTEQHKLWKDDPSKAEQLKKAADRLRNS